MYQPIKFFYHIQTDPRLKSLEERVLLNYVWGFQSNEKKCYINMDILTTVTCLSDLDLMIMIKSLKERAILKDIINYDRVLEINVNESGETIDNDLNIYAGL